MERASENFKLQCQQLINWSEKDVIKYEASRNRLLYKIHRFVAAFAFKS